MYGAPASGVYDPSMAAPQGTYEPSMGAPQPGYGGYDPSMGQPQMYDHSMGQPQMYDASMGQPQMYDASMGQPQLYDPSMGHPQKYDQQQQAARELAELEEKKKSKEEKHKQHEVEHFGKEMRLGARGQEDNTSCATILCGWGIINCLMWAAPLLGDSWWVKIWHGMGIEKLTVMVGLFNMEVHIDCRQDTGSTGLCTAMKPYSDHNGGHWALLELQKHMCTEIKDSCPTMQRLYAAGWSPLCLFPAAAVFEILALLLLYFYWHGKPSAFVRNLGNKCAMLAPACGMVGFIGWMVVSPYLNELPRLWAAAGGQKDFANSSMFGLKESFTVPMGWCCMIGFFNVISSGVRFFIQFTLPQHVNEPDAHGFNESSKLLEDAEKLYDADSKA